MLLWFLGLRPQVRERDSQFKKFSPKQDGIQRLSRLATVETHKLERETILCLPCRVVCSADERFLQSSMQMAAVELLRGEERGGMTCGKVTRVRIVY